MTDIFVNTSNIREAIPSLSAGMRVLLSGTVYTARDAAHKLITEMMQRGEQLPFPLRDAVIYFAGPTPAKPDGSVGSFGPTTSSRMDSFSPALYDAGLVATIGKGNRSEEVTDAIVRNAAVYFCAEGGLGALISKSIVSVEETAFPELGCESIKHLEVSNMPVYVGIDCRGKSIFSKENI